MAQMQINGVNLYVEDTGTGEPIIFAHEFGGDSRSWSPQVDHFAAGYRCITYNARGYPPSDIPEDESLYGQQLSTGVDLILSIALHGTIDRVFSANASLLASDKSVLAKRAFGPL